MHIPWTPLEQADSMAATGLSGAKGHAFRWTANDDGVLHIDPTELVAQWSHFLCRLSPFVQDH